MLWDSDLLEDHWTNFGDLRLYARASRLRSPDRLPVVLLHGLMVSSRYMVPTANLLARHYSVYIPDFPGFGNSDPPLEALSIRQYADILAYWIEANGIERPAVVANSMGCQIAAEFAARYPDKVSRMVLQGPTIDPQAHSISRQLWRLILNGRHEPWSRTAIAAIDTLQAGPLRLLGAVRAMFQDRIEERLPRVSVPTLVVYGGRDPVAPRPWAEQAARLLPRGSVKGIPGAPHTLNYTTPVALFRVIRPFLDEETGSGRKPQTATSPVPAGIV